jgi:hypothetical protein
MQFQLQLGPTFRGLCDASAAAPLDDFHFVAASDEPRDDGENQLLIYRYDQSEPVGHLDLNAHLQIESKRPEADIESATRVGDVIFWVTSHGRSSKGKKRPNRQRFFATQWSDGELKFWGRAHFDLHDLLISQSQLIRDAEKQKLTPEDGGLSIEGLCEGAEGELWLGFRSPLVKRNALMVLMRCDDEDLELGRFSTLDLGGRGIRDWQKTGETRWLILAGSSRGGDDFALYEWNGEPQTAPRLLGDVDEALRNCGAAGLHPEALVAWPNGEIWLFGDDGDCEINGVPNKTLPNQNRTFRSVKIIWT